jgi:hypothetical protein
MFFVLGDFVNTIVKIQEAINGCKNAISQEARGKRKETTENYIYRYLLIASIVIFFLGLSYYSYKRMMLRRATGEFFVSPKSSVKKNISVGLIFSGMLFTILLFPIKKGIVGFAIKDFFIENSKVSFGIGFIFIFLIIGILFLIIRKKQRRKIQERKYWGNKSGKF